MYTARSSHLWQVAILWGLLGAGACPARADLGLTTTAEAPPRDRGGGIVGLKLGGLFAEPFSPLAASYYVELEGGYLLPYWHRLIALTGSIGYTAPGASGGGADQRLQPSGMYTYGVTTQQLTLGLTATAKIPLGRFVPYLGIGPRVFLVRTASAGQAGAAAIAGTVETSTEVGLGVPIGLDVLLGPGRIFGEGLVLWAPVGQRSTGQSSLGALVLSAGYRLVL